MRIEDTLWLGYKDLGEKRVRTALTILMVVIGVAAIVALISLTAGISASIQDSLNTLGPTSIILSSNRPTGFTLTDTEGIASLPNVSSVTPVVEGSGTFTAAGVNTSVTVVGISEQGLVGLLSEVNLYSGTVYNDTLTPSAILGHSVAFPSTSGGIQKVSPGQPAALTINAGRTGGTTYTIPVVGVLQPYSSLIVPVDTSILMSLQAAEELLHRTSFNIILVKADNASQVGALTTTLTNIYGNNANVFSTQQIAQQVNQIVGSITFLLVVVAGISLLVAAVGIMNIMLMSVMERTHEIGIMKSLGFTNRQVLSLFLTQALLIGVVGGVIGIAVGMGGSYTLSTLASHSGSSPNSTGTASGTPSRPREGGGGGVIIGSGAGGSPGSSTSLSFSPVLTVSTIIEALVVAIGVSAIAGIYPAWRASKMEPIEALRQL